jgi:phosphohistidine phosphatase SixA
VKIFLVRHAKAGDRLHNSHDDRKRPLSKPGWAQAEALTDSLVAAGATGPLLASPFVRCRQTLEPLAKRLGLPVLRDACLAEAQPFQPMLSLMEQTPGGSVLCSHGDMIPDMIAGLERRGCVITTHPQWKKASVWMLERADDSSFVSAEAWPPPS